MLLGVVLLGCGGANRASLALRDFQSAPPDASTWAGFRGAEPTLALFWMKSALPSPERGEFRISSEESVALLEEALTFLPDHPDILSILLSRLLGEGPERDAERAVALAREGLARMPSRVSAGLFIETLAVGLLELGRLDEARHAILRLGGLMAVPPSLAGRMWALHARASAARGLTESADASFDLSLARGVDGLWTLYYGDLAPDPRQDAPPERAATRQLLERATARHPRHVDLALVLAADLAHQGRFEESELSLATLPEPAPPRLQGRITSTRAEVAIARGRLGDGVDILLAALDERPTDLDVLAALVFVQQFHAVPGEDVVLGRLWRAMSLGDRVVQMQVQQLANVLRADEPTAVDAGAP